MFEEPDTYAATQPGDAWLGRFLDAGHNIALAAFTSLRASFRLH